MAAKKAGCKSENSTEKGLVLSGNLTPFSTETGGRSFAKTYPIDDSLAMKRIPRGDASVCRRRSSARSADAHSHLPGELILNTLGRSPTDGDQRRRSARITRGGTPRRSNYSFTTSICLSMTCPVNRNACHALALAEAWCTQYSCPPSTTKREIRSISPHFPRCGQPR